jgi:3-phenylpropionate/cinnamic acid dioxygenase small subunit
VGLTDARLQSLLDEAEIRDLLLGFAHGLDDKDWAAYASTFTEDGVFEILG